MLRAVLIVEPDPGFAAHLLLLAQEAGWEGLASATFEKARRHLTAEKPAMLITNVCLGMFNGIQLAYLAKTSACSERVVAYAMREDAVLAREAQQAGAFFERRAFMPYALTRYLNASLPERDRRSCQPDRRATFRGGRRATDLAFLHAMCARGGGEHRRKEETS